MAFISAAGIVPTEPIYFFNLVVHKADVQEWKHIPSEEEEVKVDYEDHWARFNWQQS